MMERQKDEKKAIQDEKTQLQIKNEELEKQIAMLKELNMAQANQLSKEDIKRMETQQKEQFDDMKGIIKQIQSSQNLSQQSKAMIVQGSDTSQSRSNQIENDSADTFNKRQSLSFKSSKKTQQMIQTSSDKSLNKLLDDEIKPAETDHKEMGKVSANLINRFNDDADGKLVSTLHDNHKKERKSERQPDDSNNDCSTNQKTSLNPSKQSDAVDKDEVGGKDAISEIKSVESNRAIVMPSPPSVQDQVKDTFERSSKKKSLGTIKEVGSSQEEQKLTSSDENTPAELKIINKESPEQQKDKAQEQSIATGDEEKKNEPVKLNF